MKRVFTFSGTILTKSQATKLRLMRSSRILEECYHKLQAMRRQRHHVRWKLAYTRTYADGFIGRQPATSDFSHEFGSCSKKKEARAQRVFTFSGAIQIFSPLCPIFTTKTSTFPACFSLCKIISFPDPRIANFLGHSKHFSDIALIRFFTKNTNHRNTKPYNYRTQNAFFI